MKKKTPEKKKKKKTKKIFGLRQKFKNKKRRNTVIHKLARNRATKIRAAMEEGEKAL